jgi:kinesin family protein 18/19
MLGTDANPGIMALTLADLFNKIERGATENPHEKIQVSLSYLEIYNENIRDLLSGKPDVLDLRDDGSKGVVVAGITSVTANSAEEVRRSLILTTGYDVSQKRKSKSKSGTYWSQ